MNKALIYLIFTPGLARNLKSPVKSGWKIGGTYHVEKFIGFSNGSDREPGRRRGPESVT